MFNLSVCIIFDKANAKSLVACQESLPAGVEICSVQCEESAGRVPSFRVVREESFENGTVVRQGVWNFPRGGFRFDTARNLSLRLARREWILILDDDERLVSHQWRDWAQATEELGPDVGGATVGVWGSVNNGTGFERHNGSQIRLIRNHAGIYFKKRIHEFFGLRDVIADLGMIVTDTTLGIHHVGYEIPASGLLRKVRRNLRLSYQELSANPDQSDIELKLFETLQYQEQLKRV